MFLDNVTEKKLSSEKYTHFVLYTPIPLCLPTSGQLFLLFSVFFLPPTLNLILHLPLSTSIALPPCPLHVTADQSDRDP